ncbi:hypothetical protein CPB85DRAFT_1538576 [Mucidula mucida]|nr:hypothetical protein CPB85DRAFT_1538576 [Mucidula mucida]
MLRLCRRAGIFGSGTTTSWRTFATSHNVVNIVEVGPRDGLQNEKGIIPVDVKVDLINRLSNAGLQTIEAGSFVSPKWVPQMAGTAEILAQMKHHPGVHYPVLVPNQKGLDNLLATSPVQTDEISIFTAATDAFTIAPVVRSALDHGLRVRGYVSVVIACPYSGFVDAKAVRDVAKELVELGCYEVSLGDTVGMGTPSQVTSMIEEVTKSVAVDKLAGHFHDTYGTAIANMFAALDQGVRTFDSSVGGLGGCPYSPGATGNVATEDVLYALRGSPFSVSGNIDLDQLVDIGWWISEQLGRESISRVGRAIRSKKLRETKAKL